MFVDIKQLDRKFDTLFGPDNLTWVRYDKGGYKDWKIEEFDRLYQTTVHDNEESESEDENEHDNIDEGMPTYDKGAEIDN